MQGRKYRATDVEEIDWNQAWKESKAKRTSGPRDNRFWDRRAPSFAKHTTETVYPGAFLEIMAPRPRWSVLDMACGGGTLALPLARRVRRITAVDFSDRMLDILNGKCEEERITNIRAVNARWEDNWKDMGIGLHDVAIASRSLVVDDLRAAILKLEASARERVYISTIVGDGPYDRRVFEALGRDLYMGPDYIYHYNLLYQMGIRASVAFIDERNDRRFEDHDDALNTMRWMLDNMTHEEEEKLRKYLKKHLAQDDRGWRMDYSRAVRWAVIWWDISGRGDV